MEVTVKDTAYEIRPGHDLKEAISLHGEDRVYALYLLYFIEKAKQAIRQRTVAGESPEQTKVFIETKWRPILHPTKKIIDTHRRLT